MKNESDIHKTIHSWPTLYKISNGSKRYWAIWVTSSREGATIITEYGIVGTCSPQYSETNFYEGKNIGRANETTPTSQACSEANAKYLLKLSKGFAPQGEAPAAGIKLDGGADYIISNGPMLAHDYNKQGHKIKWPAYWQPKLDGIRCIAVIENGEAKLYSRAGNRFYALRHIADALAERFANRKIGGVTILDGELYNHDMHDEFSRIVSAVKRDEPGAQSNLIQYHIYDLASEPKLEFWERSEILRGWFEPANFAEIREHILRFVPTRIIDSEEDVLNAFESARSDHYEGIMLRNNFSLYEQKRSYNLQKVKEFEDAEFFVVDALEGRGKLEGHVGAFVCELPGGDTFKVKLRGSHEFLRQCWENDSLWRNAWMTVQFQGYGSQGRPRGPIGIRFRDKSVD